MKPRALRYATCIAAVGLIGVAACSSSSSSSVGGSSGGDNSSATASAAAKFDHNQLTIIIPSAPGGNLDTNVRLLQPALQNALGATVIVQNNAVGSGLGAAQQLLQMGGDCSQIIANNIPAILYNIKKNPSTIQSDEFEPVANILTDYGTIQVLKNSKWKTFSQFIADAKANPGKISISVASTVVSNYQGMLDLEKAAGVKFNIVPFTGGGPARTALLGGQVDATASNIFESLSIASKTTVLAVQQPDNKWPSQTKDAPTMSSALGVTVPSSSTLYGLFTSSKCKSSNPGDFQAIENAVGAASKDTSFTSQLQKLGTQPSLDYMDASQFSGAISPIAKEIGVQPLGG